MPADRLCIKILKTSFLTILNYKTVCACRSSIMGIPPVPNLPKTLKFPQGSFGQKNPVKRSFQSSWFANKTWLHYDEANDLAYCHVCMVAYRDGNLNSSNLDKAFMLNVFSSWKDASVVFKNRVEIVVFSIFVLSAAQTLQWSEIFLPTYLQNWLNI